MANNKLLVDERQADLGGFLVGRLLPFRKKRQVGPFTFIDHMGPSVFKNGVYMDVDQHPHIGLSTLTYLFDGSIAHRDSTGANQIINPGDVGFMTSGKGVTHTERTPQSHRDGRSISMHGYQIWVALPSHLEDIDPHFEFYQKDALPNWSEGAVDMRLIAGSAFGNTSPLQGYSPMFIIDIKANEETTLCLGGRLEGELAFVIVNGSIKSGDEYIKQGQMLISKTDAECEICMEAGTQILLFGGQPLNEEPLMMWNFVSSSKEKLTQAKEDWINRKFPKVPNDDSYIPYPTMKK